MAGQALLNAQTLLRAAGIRPGMRVADFGVGRSGHLVFPATKWVGEEGKVFAVDLQPEVLSMLEGRRRQYLVHNLDTVHGDFETAGGVGIEAGSLDVAFVTNTLWTLKHHVEAIKELRRLLRVDGRIVVVDWLPNTPHPIAPPAHLRMGPEAADVYFVSGGCEVCGDFRPSDWHWGRVYGAMS